VSNWAYLTHRGPLIVTVEEAIEGLRLYIGPEDHTDLWQLDIFEDETLIEIHDTCARIIADREEDRKP